MSKKMKLNINKIKLQSFVTSDDSLNQGKIKGGATIISCFVPDCPIPVTYTCPPHTQETCPAECFETLKRGCGV